MEQPTQPTMPSGINAYIRAHFKDDYLTDIRPYTSNQGHTYWFVDVTHDSTVYHLRFNSEGRLVEQDVDPISYPGDDVEIGEAD